ESNHWIAWKEFQKSFEHRHAGSSLAASRRPIAQQTFIRIERVPRKCVPENKFSRLDPELEQRTPHNRRCRLRKTIAAYFLFARSACHKVRDKLLRSDY